MNESKKRIGSDLAKVDAHVIQPHEYEEAPEWTAEDFERADLYHGDKLIRRGRPPSERPKITMSPGATLRVVVRKIHAASASRSRPWANWSSPCTAPMITRCPRCRAARCASWRCAA